MKPASPSRNDRRAVLAGAGAVGALAGAAATLPQVRRTPGAADAAAEAAAHGKPGYRLTEHVLRYYQTARV